MGIHPRHTRLNNLVCSALTRIYDPGGLLTSSSEIILFWHRRCIHETDKGMYQLIEYV